MNNLEINKVLSRSPLTADCYQGCYAADRIPKGLNRFPHCMVVNTASTEEPGEHWVALYAPAENSIEYYDSFADWPPTSPHIRAYLEHFAKVERSEHPLQSERSSACGRHVIYFLIRRCQGWPLKRIVSHLRTCKTAPDRLVNTFVRQQIFSDSQSGAAADSLTMY